MTTKRLLLAALLFGSLAQAQAQAQTQATERVIQVEVVGGKIRVPESTVLVGRQVGSIRWALAGAGLTFPANGIVIDANAFQNCRVLAQGRQFQCVRKGYVAGQQYKYDVNVNQGGTPLPTLDPFIQNE